MKIINDKKIKLAYIISALLIFLTIAAVCIAVIQNVSQVKNKHDNIPETQTFTPEQPFLLPSDDLTTRNYIFSHPHDKKWNEDDIKRWFTEPDENKINELDSTNKAITDEIIGDAP